MTLWVRVAARIGDDADTGRMSDRSYLSAIAWAGWSARMCVCSGSRSRRVANVRGRPYSRRDSDRKLISRTSSSRRAASLSWGPHIMEPVWHDGRSFSLSPSVSSSRRMPKSWRCWSATRRCWRGSRTDSIRWFSRAARKASGSRSAAFLRNCL